MLQWDGGQAACADTFPNWSAQNPPVIVTGVPLPAAVLGPSMQGTATLMSIFNNLADIELAERDPNAGSGWKVRTSIQGLYPGSYIFPKTLGFRAKNHNAGQVVQVIGQVWETVDGPVPTTPLGPNTGFLSATGSITPTLISYAVLSPGLQSMASNVYADVASMSLTIPAGGKYLIDYSAYVDSGYAGGTGSAFLALNVGGAIVDEVDSDATNPNAIYRGTLRGVWEGTVANATVVKLQWHTNMGTPSIGGRNFALIVSPGP